VSPARDWRVLRAWLPALLVLVGLLSPGLARAERELLDYRLHADLRTRPAKIEVQLTYASPELKLDTSEATQGFKFVGREQPRALEAHTPEGKPLEIQLDRNSFEEKLIYELPKTETGESTVILGFEQDTTVARELRAGRVKTVIPWAHVWKIPVRRMEVELLFPADVPAVEGWECTSDSEGLRCTRVSDVLVPVIVEHRGIPANSPLIWAPIATVLVLLGLVFLARHWWVKEKGVIPGEAPEEAGSQWQPPGDLSLKPRLSQADRKQFVTRLSCVCGVIVASAGACLVWASEGMHFLNLETGGSLWFQLILVLGLTTLAALLAIRPKVGHAIGLIPFAVTALVPVLAVLLNLFAFFLGMFVVAFTLPLALIGSGGGGGGGGYSSGCSSCGSGCSSCGSSCGGGCGGGCGGCGG
jgi:hypothetical protein